MDAVDPPSMAGAAVKSPSFSTRLFSKLQDVELHDLEAPLPLDSRVQHGTLKNGLSYYVRQCSKPKGRCALSLAVKVGSVVEDDDVQGVAHMVEHLAFNATEHRTNHEIVKFLESIGAQFGACQNAYTSADETVYQLLVPVDHQAGREDLDLLEQALGVMAEFAFSIRCADGDIKKERGAVLEEWRSNRTASGRAQEAHWRLIMQGCRYADRLPIGKEFVVRTVAAAKVKAFYERWYRPEHMAVIAVGDFPDPSAVVAMVEAAFGNGASRDASPCPAIPTYTFAPHDTPRYQVFVDREAQSPQVFVSFKRSRAQLSSPRHFLEHLQSWLFQEVLNTRLFKLSREQDPPLLSGGVAEEPLTRTTQSGVLTAVALAGGVLRALECLLVEVARLRLHGITPKEFAHAIADFKSDVENTYRERDQSYCWDVRDEYARHFLNGEFVTGQEFEARLSKTLLSHVTREHVEQVAHWFHPSQSCVVKVVEHRQSQTEANLEALVQKVLDMEKQGSIGPWEGDTALPDQLLPHTLTPLPQEQAIVSERKYELLNATELTLSNGMVVLFKETSFMEDEVLLTGCASGGLSEVPRGSHYTAACAGVVAGQLGIFGIKPTLLNDFLAGTPVDMSTSEGAFSRSFRSAQSPEDLEVAMQLVHALFTTNVQVDDRELQVVVRMLYESVDAQQRNPVNHFFSRVRAVNYGSCYYFEPLTHKDVRRVDMHKACEHHNMSYRNPAEFKVVLTGNVSRELLLPLVLKYLATLPPRDFPPPKGPRDVQPLQWSPPTEPVVEDVPVAMVSPITQTQLTFPVVLEKSSGREDIVWLLLACRILETRLMQQLRFKFGEIYSVSVSSFFGCEAPSNTGNPRGDVAVSFTCDPANRSHLLEMALQEVEAMQSGQISAEELQTVLTLVRLETEEAEQENSHWHDVAVSGYQSKSFAATGDLDEVHRRTQAARAKVLGAADPAGIQAAMCRLFPHPCRKCYTALSMVPRDQGWLRWPRQLASSVARLVDGSPVATRTLLGLSLAGSVIAMVWLASRRRSQPVQNASG